MNSDCVDLPELSNFCIYLQNELIKCRKTNLFEKSCITESFNYFNCLEKYIQLQQYSCADSKYSKPKKQIDGTRRY